MLFCLGKVALIFTSMYTITSMGLGVKSLPLTFSATGDIDRFMARPLRIFYPNAFYHVTCRGNERREIYRDDNDRSVFLEKLKISLGIYRVRFQA
jgi:hypothetical protein